MAAIGIPRAGRGRELRTPEDSSGAVRTRTGRSWTRRSSQVGTKDEWVKRTPRRVRFRAAIDVGPRSHRAVQDRRQERIPRARSDGTGLVSDMTREDDRQPG